MTALLIAAALVLAFITSLVTTPYVRRLAQSVGMLDVTGERRMHDVPKPRIGGIAVYLGFSFALFSAIGYLINAHYLRRGSDLQTVHDMIGLIFGGTLICMIGIWDDVMGMNPRAKLLAQVVVAAVSMLYGFMISFVRDPFHHGTVVFFPLWVSVPITLIWYVGMMNAINFIDGLDGLLSGLTAIAGMFLLVINLTHGHPEIALVLAALVGGTLGFLPVQLQSGEDHPRRLGRAVHRLRLRDGLDHRREQTGVHDLAARPADRAGAADRRHRGGHRPPHARRPEDLRSRPRPFPPSAGLPIRTERPASGAADLRAVRRARRAGALPLGLARRRAPRMTAVAGRGR